MALDSRFVANGQLKPILPELINVGNSNLVEYDSDRCQNFIAVFRTYDQWILKVSSKSTPQLSK